MNQEQKFIFHVAAFFFIIKAISLLLSLKENSEFWGFLFQVKLQVEFILLHTEAEVQKQDLHPLQCLEIAPPTFKPVDINNFDHLLSVEEEKRALS